MRNWRTLLKDSARKVGFNVSRVRAEPFGVDAYRDMGTLLSGTPDLMVLDVGANIGQSVERFRAVMPSCTVHSFEPSPATFRALASRCECLPNVHLWNTALGARDGTQILLENQQSDMTSFLAPAADAWGHVHRETLVPVTTVDAFAARLGVQRIHVLKSDTQGFDFEVVKGALGMMSAHRIDLIYLELIFSKMYSSLPSFCDVYRCLEEHDFALVGVYGQRHQGGLLGWADFLFASKGSGFRANCSV